jgi:hypothetical protein
MSFRDPVRPNCGVRAVEAANEPIEYRIYMRTLKVEHLVYLSCADPVLARCREVPVQRRGIVEGTTALSRVCLRQIHVHAHTGPRCALSSAKQSHTLIVADPRSDDSGPGHFFRDERGLITSSREIITVQSASPLSVIPPYVRWIDSTSSNGQCHDMHPKRTPGVTHSSSATRRFVGQVRMDMAG